MHKTMMLMFNNMTQKKNVIVDMAYDVKMGFNYTYIEYYSSLVTPIQSKQVFIINEHNNVCIATKA